MALIKCPECGQEVSDTAKSCPHCGCADFQLKKRKNGFNVQKIKWSIIIIIVICSLFFIKNVISSNQKQNDVKNANRAIDNLIDTVSELSDVKLYNNSSSNTVENNVGQMKEYVEEINNVYGKYDVDICNEIDTYIKSNTDEKSWNDYIVMLSREFYLLDETNEAVKRIMDSGTVPDSVGLKNYDQIENGMTEKEVINILGQPSSVHTLEGKTRYDYEGKVTIWFDTSGLVYKTKMW